MIHYRKIFDSLISPFSAFIPTPSRYFQSGGTRTQQFARVYIPLRKRVDGKYPGATRARAPRIRAASSIVSRLRKAVLSRIIRLHGIIAYTGRDRRTPVARLHLFSTAVCFPAPGYFAPVEGKIDTLSTEVTRT